MKEKKITICGKEVGIAYCMATEQTFEELTDKSIRQLNPERERDLLLLSLAAVMVYASYHKQEAELSVEDLLYKASPKEVQTLVSEVAELRNEWYEVPKTLDAQEGEQEEEGAEKN